MPAAKKRSKSRIASRRERTDLAGSIKTLERIERAIRHRKNITEPTYYKMPDLLCPQGYNFGEWDEETGTIRRVRMAHPESDEDYKKRQDDAIAKFIRERLFIAKDGKDIPIVVTDEMLEFISDVFFKRVQQVIVWKSRGSGGSLCAAVVMWLALVYYKMSFVDVAGALEQAKVVYDYVTQFWDCIPGLKKNLLVGDPLISATNLKSGATLRCITSSEKQARGKHVSGLTIDESCQRDSSSDDAFKAAMNVTMSEDDRIIIMLSTFHVPVGLFQEYWDFAEERGFKRYKWDIISVMKPCKEGMEFATSDDPRALKFCRESCPLTDRIELRADDGTVTGHTFKGCDGRARTSKGFMSRKNVIEAKVTNAGSEVFNVEFLCERPQFSGPIYGLSAIERAVVDEVEDPYPDEGRIVVGIDWGIVEGVLVLIKDCKDFITVIESRYMSAKLTSEFAKILYEWEDEYGKLEVFADSSHPFNNADLEEMGFDVTAVEFAVLKEEGISNLLKMFVHDKIRIISETNQMLINQLKKYHRDQKTGKPVKVEDHGPDGLMVGSIAFDFMEKWPEALAITAPDGTIRNKRDRNDKRTDIDEKGVDKHGDVLLF